MINENSKLVLQVILDRYLVLKSIKNTENELYLITQHMDKIENDKSKKIEFYNYKDRKLQASENLINSKTNLAQLNSLLENVVGLDNAKKQFKISNLISLDALALPDPGQLIEDSKTHNINIVLKKSELNLASVRVKRAKPGINPTLDFTVNTTGSMGSPGNSGFKSKTTTFGLQLNMSLLDGGGNSSAYSDAITQLNKASNDLEGLKKTIDKNLSDEYFYFNNLKGLIEIKKNMIKNKKDVMVVNRSMYAGVDDGFLLSADVDYQININDLELQISRLHRDAILNWITLISAGKNIGKTEFDVLSNLIEIE
jgi:outer membrane protein